MNPDETFWLTLGAFCARADRLNQPWRLMQGERCLECGVEGCATVGWVTLRRLGSFAVAMPAFEEVLDDSFLPPQAFYTEGTPFVAVKDWVERMPNPETEGYLLSFVDGVERLSGEELLRILQWEAPLGVLGHGGDPVEVHDDRVLAASHGSRKDAVLEVTALIDRMERLHEPNIEPSLPGDEPVVLYLEDEAGFTHDWPVAVLRDGRWLLSPSPGFVVA